MAKVLGPDGKIVAARTFEASAPAARLDPPVAAAALNVAFGKSITALVLWASEMVGKASAASPGKVSPGTASPTRASPNEPSAADPAAGPSGL